MLIKFVKRPEGFYMDITGAAYKQITPFEPVKRDWNNDGDTYTETVAVFRWLEESRQGTWRTPPRKLVLSKYEFDSLLHNGDIIIIGGGNTP